MVGLGDARVVKAGVVSGSFFEVMGLQPVLGRLIEASDDGPAAASVAVLTHRFWTDSLESDPSVIGKVIQLGANNTTVVGVLEPSVPYPADTEVIANVVTSSHHLDATMVTERTHRMTELFGRLAVGASVEDARADLIAVHAAMMRDHPGAYPASAGTRITVRLLRDQITAPARTILLILVTAAGLVFVIACSNVANLILARSLRREGELAVRAALGASHGALRRTLLAESLVLCGAGAVLGVLLAHPLLAVVARFAARFSVRAVEVTVDNSLLGVGAGLAIAAAVLLAYIPRLPAFAPPGLRRGGPVHRSLGEGGSVRITPSTNRRLRAFAMTQIAFSFVLLAGAGTLLSSLLALQTADTGIDLRQVLALDLPTPSMSLRDAKEKAFYQDLTRRIDQLPGVEGVALGTTVPWRDAGRLSNTLQYTVEGHAIAPGQEYPRARLRAIAPGFFTVLGVPMIAGREFTDDDSAENEPVVIVSESIANRLFAGRDAVNQIFWWTDPLFDKAQPRRIVGVVRDVDDEHLVPQPAPTIYHPVQQIGVAGRLFVRAEGDPYSLVLPLRQLIHEISPNQPVERAATLADVRAEVLSPNRLSALVLSGFAGVALLIAMVGVAGVLAFSVNARTREFGVRLALGSSPRRLLLGVVLEGALIVGIGIAAGAAGGFAFSSIATSYVDNIRFPGVLPIAGAALILAGAAVVASLMPAARASHVDVLQALRSE